MPPTLDFKFLHQLNLRIRSALVVLYACRDNQTLVHERASRYYRMPTLVRAVYGKGSQSVDFSHADMRPRLCRHNRSARLGQNINSSSSSNNRGNGIGNNSGNNTDNSKGLETKIIAKYDLIYPKCVVAVPRGKAKGSANGHPRGASYLTHHVDTSTLSAGGLKR